MLIKTSAPVAMGLQRAGGSIIVSRVDYWSATSTGWQLAGSNLFQNVALPVETQAAKLKKGQYTAVFTCRVEESVNGVYDFGFDVAGTRVYADKGNVNTTSDPHDAKVYRDQFIIEVV